MIRIGSNNRLRFSRKRDAGIMLTDGKDEVLLPTRLAPKDLEAGSEIEVFVYTDSEDRPVATTQKPLAKVGDFACLKAIDESRHGIFLDWGLDKDLFVPHSEQHTPMSVGQHYVVAVFLDNGTNRVAAASKLGDFFDYDLSDVKEGDEVDLFVHGFHNRGTGVIVSDRYSGLIYRDQSFKKLNVGDRLTGYVDKVREDNKLDIRLNRAGHQSGKAKVDSAQSIVLGALEKGDGILQLGDKSSPDLIYAELGISKKAFKAAVGVLFRAGKVEPGSHTTKILKKS